MQEYVLEVYRACARWIFHMGQGDWLLVLLAATVVGYFLLRGHASHAR